MRCTEVLHVLFGERARDPRPVARVRSPVGAHRRYAEKTRMLLAAHAYVNQASLEGVTC
jgi:hypothetical protein